MNAYLGTVKWYSNTLKYGFIRFTLYDRQEEAFVHWTAIEPGIKKRFKSLKKGSTVYFDLMKDGDRFRALNVHPATVAA